MEMKNKAVKKAKKFIGRRVVIDASLVMKTFIKEDGSDFVDEMIKLNKMQKLALVAPAFLVYELMNALAKKWHNKARARFALDKFDKTGISLIDYQYGFLRRGVDQACSEKLISLYDSAYHALAKEMDAVFLTADRKYFELMKNQGSIELV